MAALIFSGERVQLPTISVFFDQYYVAPLITCFPCAHSGPCQRFNQELLYSDRTNLDCTKSDPFC